MGSRGGGAAGTWLALASVFLSPAAGRCAEAGGLALWTPARARFSFGGELGRRIERNADAWLLPAPLANPGMLGMFRLRDRKPEPSLVPWAGEFAGKYPISAIQALRITRRPELEPAVDRFIRELISLQAEDGYLGPFPERERLLGHWDLWGHYHLLLALLLRHEDTGSAEALGAARRAVDLICRTFLDGPRRVIDAGSPEMNMAVIHALGPARRSPSTERRAGRATRSPPSPSGTTPRRSAWPPARSRRAGWRR